jgi:hypothetical protein
MAEFAQEFNGAPHHTTRQRVATNLGSRAPGGSTDGALTDAIQQLVDRALIWAAQFARRLVAAFTP